MVSEELELAEDDPMRNFLPTSFGKQAKTANVEEQIRRTKRASAAAKSPERPLAGLPHVGEIPR